MHFKASSVRTKQRLKVKMEKGTHTHTMVIAKGCLPPFKKWQKTNT